MTHHADSPPTFRVAATGLPALRDLCCVKLQHTQVNGIRNCCRWSLTLSCSLSPHEYCNAQRSHTHTLPNATRWWISRHGFGLPAITWWRQLSTAWPVSQAWKNRSRITKVSAVFSAVTNRLPPLFPRFSPFSFLRGWLRLLGGHPERNYCGSGGSSGWILHLSEEETVLQQPTG